MKKYLTFALAIVLLLFTIGYYFHDSKPVNEIQIKKFKLSTDVEAEDYYYSTITTNSISCDKSYRIGRQDDGGWDVCFDEKYKLKSSNCISYSFGVNNIWEYDDEIATKYKCVVRTFDPSMTKLPDELQRQSKVWFYKIGLTNKDTKWSNGWNMMKMSSILKKFNDKNKIIDILKIDIEYSEWDSFESMIKDGLLSKVKQLLFETHTIEVQGKSTSLENFERYLRIWNDLHKIGFRQWKNHFNPYGEYTSKRTNKKRTCCYEHYMININI